VIDEFTPKQIPLTARSDEELDDTDGVSGRAGTGLSVRYEAGLSQVQFARRFGFTLDKCDMSSAVGVLPDPRRRYFG
jgi:hypothetical protein